jgi:hypothetical protein
MTNTSSYAALIKISKISNIAVADDVAFMNDLIYNQGAVIGGVFAGDNFIYWGVSVLFNSGGTTNAYGGGSAGRTYDTGYSSFTINMRSSTTSTTFDRKLFTVRPSGQMIMYNDIWHIINDNINRFYSANNGATFLCGAAGDNGFVVYSSGATGYANNLVMKNNGDTTIRGNIYCGGDLSIGNGLTYLSKAGNSLGTLKLGLGAVSGASENTNMRIEIHELIFWKIKII